MTASRSTSTRGLPALAALALAATAATAALPGIAFAAGRPTTSAGAASLMIRGRGDGHGVGMPQDGALAMGRAGASARTILGTFYPGTSVQKWRGAHLHIAVLAVQPAASTVVLSLPQGGTVTGPGGSSLSVPAAGHITLTQDTGGWTAALQAPPIGTGGQGVPVTRDDDPAPTPTSADSSSPAPSDSSSADPSGSPSDSPSTTPTTAQTSPTAQTASSAPAQAPPPSSEPTTVGAPGSPAGAPASAAPTDVSAAEVHRVAKPTTATAPTAAGATTASATAKPAIKRLPVRGAELHVVPAKNGVTSLDAQGRSYRGELVTAPGELVDDVTVEDYLLGLGEVRDPDWPAAGLQAQVMAARTYALRAAFAANDAATPAHVNFCATDSCQVYLGAGAEYPALTAAVHATDHLAVVYSHELAETYYSASGGGETATPAEGFGPSAAAVPYLVPVTYDTGGGDGWQRSLDPAAVATSLGYAGTLLSLEVTARGPSGRATAVVLHGSAGDVTTTGLAVAQALDLPSTYFETGSGIAAPQIDAVSATGTGADATAAVGVGFPANQPVALTVVPPVPLPQVAPAVAAPAAGTAGTPSGLAPVTGLTANSAGLLQPNRAAGGRTLASATGAARYGRAGTGGYTVLDGLLLLLTAAGGGVTLRRRRISLR